MLRKLSIGILRCSTNGSHFPCVAKDNLIYLSASTSATATEKADERIRPISEMPGLKTFPLIGSALTMVTRKDFKVDKNHIMWQNIATELGPIFKVVFPTVPPMVFVCNPDDIETAFRATMDNPTRNAFYSLKKVRYEEPTNFFEKKGGLLIENGEEWWRVRSKAQTPMMKKKNLNKYLPKMDQVSLEFMEIISTFQKEFGEMPSNFQEELYKWAFESVGLVAFNRRLGCLQPNLPENSPQMEMIKAVNILIAMNNTEMKLPLWKLFPTPSYNKLKRGHEVFMKMAIAHINETEKEMKLIQNSEKNDDREIGVLQELLQKDGLTRKDVVTLILDMLFAGIDSTAHTLGFTLYLLAKNKEAQKTVQKEVDSVLGDGRCPITEENLAQLSFLKSCIKESLRIFPIAIGHGRTLQRDTILGGYNVPKGHMVLMLTSVPSNDDSVFSRAAEFHPERWGRDHPLGPIHPFASLPFSHGPRMCIGRRIAEQEMYTFLARVMHRFNVDYKYKDMEMISRFISMPSEPLRFTFTERR